MQVNKARTALAEINVTPLVDVMLVLLIIFMVCAPMMQQGVQVDLPQANAAPINEVPEQLVLTINARGQIDLNKTIIDLPDLRAQLAKIARTAPKTEVAIRADQNVNYGVVAKVMAAVKGAGIHRVGLVTEPEGKK